MEENKKQGKCEYGTERGGGWGQRLPWRPSRCARESHDADVASAVSAPDPEVHIGLENLQQFPAFGSPPHDRSPPAQLDFALGPPSPLSCSPASGE